GAVLHRTPGRDQSDRRVRWPGGPQAAAGRDRARVGRRDPGERAGVALREGRSGPRRARSVDARRLARVAGGGPADRQPRVPRQRVQEPGRQPARGAEDRGGLPRRGGLRRRRGRGPGTADRPAAPLARALRAAGERMRRALPLGPPGLRQL
ncbi:MAG: hypothetical protein AVDCRST_MAG67-2378, partial [uncultured Solirubrobacteraceae bacterium]